MWAFFRAERTKEWKQIKIESETIPLLNLVYSRNKHYDGIGTNLFQYSYDSIILDIVTLRNLTSETGLPYHVQQSSSNEKQNENRYHVQCA